MYLENIHSPQDVKALAGDQLPVLAQEIRDALLRRAAAHGGHFGPNFGFVEATIALHYVFDSPRDHFVFDVSHQTYPHKMLTGRVDAYLDPARYDEVSGYSNPAESDHDLFEVGHTSTSISLALGLAKARDLAGRHENVVAVIGDGSLSGGEALEGLDVAGELGSNFVIVFNDNQMSIAENHGGMYAGLARLRETGGKAEDNLFRAMGLDYRYVADGNDCAALVAAFEEVRDIDHPVVVHVNTLKGKGYAPAEQDPEPWHYNAPFDLATGRPLRQGSGEGYGSITAHYLLERAKSDRDLLVLAAAVPGTLGLGPSQRADLGEHYLDVGIAEETAVALASGAAKAGAHVVFGTQVTFLQRVYDQLSQDLSINHNPATIVGANASVWGMSDVTHAAFYSIPMVANIPGITYLAPTNVEEYLSMLGWSLDQEEGPVYIALPAGPVRHAPEGAVQRDDYSQTRWEHAREGKRVAILALGDFFGLGERAADLLAEHGVEATLVNPLFASGLDEGALDKIARTHELVVTLEDGSVDGGFGQRVAGRLAADPSTRVLVRGFAKAFYDRYDADELLREARLTPEQVCEDVLAQLGA
ncbi:1-deoxy-D-xylulose-5-phosphate synthase [Olsenella sp. DNF00959]|uniref:1-deoxy-D-xylulose-5-phosphate synthase n=1 Tax=Olsenella sp. DNF00959 TaxID=1476999 RepID=UPI000784888B|nr:1-deoxy-D-xylulose-5-phosphate synthase [Olsenella sp. DNF00959]KXB62295.1 putative 1-deoxy-D-xylulose-5-phosphate synthase [Olsenella sp. DNF00959]